MGLTSTPFVAFGTVVKTNNSVRQEFKKSITKTPTMNFLPSTRHSFRNIAVSLVGGVWEEMYAIQYLEFRRKKLLFLGHGVYARVLPYISKRLPVKTKPHSIDPRPVRSPSKAAMPMLKGRRAPVCLNFRPVSPSQAAKTVITRTKVHRTSPPKASTAFNG